MKLPALYKFTNVILVFLFILFIAACNLQDNETVKKEKELNKIKHDSLVATGTHGYYTMNFIVGRLRTTPLLDNDAPYNINIVNIDPELLEKYMRFKIVDSLRYTIEYEKEQQELTQLHGYFGRKLADKKIQLIVNSTFDPKHAAIFKPIEYQFKVHSY